jgi:Fe(3+) dicitrate transport protein
MKGSWALKAGAFAVLVATQQWASAQTADPEATAVIRDEEGTPTAIVDRIVVTASPAETREVGGSVQFIDAETLSISEYADPTRVLRQVPGINLVEEDGYGLRPNIGIRGSGTDRSSKIAVMEDGVLIAPAPYAAPAAYYFPRTPRISAWEITKGPAAIKYGPQTVAGAINMFSTPIPDKPGGGVGGEVGLYAGDNSTTRAYGIVGGYFETSGAFEVGLSLEALNEHSDGFKKLDSGGSTGYDIEDYVAKIAFRSAPGASLNQALELKFQTSDEQSDETYLGLTLDDFRADPYRRYRGSQRDVMNVDHQTYQATHRIDLTERMDLTTVAYYTHTKRSWYKVNDVLDGGTLQSISSVLADPTTFATGYQTLVGAPGFTSAANALRVRNNNREYYAAGIQTVLGIGFQAGATSHDLELSARYHQDEEDRFQDDDRYQMVNGTMVLTQDGAPGSQENRVGDVNAWAFYARDTIRWNQWTVVPGLRYETMELRRTTYGTNDPDRTGPTTVVKDDVEVWIPGLSATYDLTERWKLLGGVHRGFANPSPGSEADPETSWNYEAGVRFNAAAASLDLIGFVVDYENLVGTCTASTGGGCTIGDQFDGGKAQVYGLEVLARYDAGPRLGTRLGVPLTIAYTYTQGEFKSSFDSDFAEWGDVTAGDSLPNVPEHQFTLSAGLQSVKWRTFLNLNYVSDARSVAGTGPIPEDERIEARTIIDVTGELDVTSNVSLFASVQNITDEVYIVSFSPAGARPGLPRTFLAGIKARF